MRVISFDQSSAITGYAIFEDGNYIQSGVIDLRNDHNTINRTKNMMLLICQLINSKQIDTVIFEDIQRQTNTATYKLLSQLQGAMMYFCYSNEIKYIALPSSTWRKILGFKQGGRVLRKQLKVQAINYVQEHCGKTVSEDEADAICVGLAAILDNRIRK